MKPDRLLAKLNDLLNQATHERSHYYVAGTIKDCVEYVLSHLDSEAEVRERERAAFVAAIREQVYPVLDPIAAVEWAEAEALRRHKEA